ncbi:MAG: ABC transporter ATP-binding protein [Candidimonas sp.]
MSEFQKNDGAILLDIDDVAKTFGDTTALKGVSLHVREGEFLTLLGPSGCGKTTLIRIIAGFESPTAGNVKIDGKSILDAPPYRRPLGMVFQSLALFPHLSVADNIAYGLKIRGLAKDLIRQKVEGALDMVGLAGMGKRYTGQISGGQRQRVALARAIVTEPRVLLLDEPLGALDLKIRRQMQTELKQIQERLGTTFIFVTHDQEEALTMSDRIAVFREGTIEQVAEPNVIYQQPATRFVAEFVGDTNFFEGSIQSEIGGASRFHSPDLPAGIPLTSMSLPDGARVGVSLRPQHVKITDASRALAQARVIRHVYAGQSTRLWLQMGERTLIADCSESDGRQTIPSPGQTVGLDWDPRNLSVVSL